MRILSGLMVCLLVSGAVHAGETASATESIGPPREVLDWIEANAIPLATVQASAHDELTETGLDALIALLGNAEVIGLGEGTHGTAEFYSFKDQLIRRLTARQSLDAILWEVDVTGIRSIKELLDQSPTMAEAAANEMRGYNWRTEEVASHLRWYASLDIASRPDVYGVDIFDIHGGIRLAFGDLKESDPERASYVLSGLSTLLNTPVETLLSDKAAFNKAIEGLTRRELRELGAWLDLLAESVDETASELDVRLASRAAAQRIEHLLQFYTLVPDVPGEPAHSALGQYRNMLKRAGEAAETLSGFGERVDPGAVTEMSEMLEVLRDPQAVFGIWSSLSPAERAAWKDAVAASSAHLIVRTGLYKTNGVDPTSALSAADTLSAFLAFVHETEATTPEREILNRREVAIARNIQTIRDAQPPSARIAFWAHNLHINRSAGPEGRTAGALLAESLGSRYVSIGTFFGAGSFQARDLRAARDADFGPAIRAFDLESAPTGSFEAALAASGTLPFALDLRSLPSTGPVADWFRQERSTRNIGNQYNPNRAERYFFEIVPSEHFDIVVFFPRTRRATPTAASLTTYSFDVSP